MSEDLIIGPEHAEGPTPGIDIDAVEWDETPAVTFAETAMYMYTSCQEIDTMVMSKADARRIEQIKRWSLRVAHHYMKDIYTDVFDKDDDD